MSSINQCTYDVTGSSDILQYYRVCLTCSEACWQTGEDVRVCLNCASICHEEHVLGPLLREKFHCLCHENEGHYCRASKTYSDAFILQHHHHQRRRAQASSNLHAAEMAALNPPSPPQSYSSGLEKKVVVWSHAISDNSPKKVEKIVSDDSDAVDATREAVGDDRDKAKRTILGIFDDIDDANELVKTAFVDDNPWDYCATELKSSEHFVCQYSSHGLAKYAVMLPAQKEGEGSGKIDSTTGQEAIVKVEGGAEVVMDVAEGDGSTQEIMDMTGTSNLAGSSTESFSTTSKDVTQQETGTSGLQRWEVAAEFLDTFLQDYGCYPAQSSLISAHRAKNARAGRRAALSAPSEVVSTFLSNHVVQNPPMSTQQWASLVKQSSLLSKKGGSKKAPSQFDTSSKASSTSSRKRPSQASLDHVMELVLHDGNVSEASSEALMMTSKPPPITSNSDNKVSGRKRPRETAVATPNEGDAHTATTVTASTKKAGSNRTKEAGAPKGPSASFMVFMNQTRASLRAERPDLSMTEMTKVLGDRWRHMRAEDKVPFEELARLDRERYAREMAVFQEQKKQRLLALSQAAEEHEQVEGSDSARVVSKSDGVEGEREYDDPLRLSQDSRTTPEKLGSKAQMSTPNKKAKSSIEDEDSIDDDKDDDKGSVEDEEQEDRWMVWSTRDGQTKKIEGTYLCILSANRVARNLFETTMKQSPLNKRKSETLQLCEEENEEGLVTLTASEVSVASEKDNGPGLVYRVGVIGELDFFGAV